MAASPFRGPSRLVRQTALAARFPTHGREIDPKRLPSLSSTTRQTAVTWMAENESGTTSGR